MSNIGLIKLLLTIGCDDTDEVLIKQTIVNFDCLFLMTYRSYNKLFTKCYPETVINLRDDEVFKLMFYSSNSYNNDILTFVFNYDLEQTKRIIDFKENDETLLYKIIKDKNYDFVEKILALGADVNSNYCGSTPLHKAARHNNFKVVSSLLFSGADKTLKDWKFKTAEEIARKQGNNEVADYIRDYCQDVKEPCSY